MTKIIHITACNQCPHLTSQEEGDCRPIMVFYCGKRGDTWGKEIHPAEVKARVPDWCQLEDVPAELLKVGYLRELAAANAFRTALADLLAWGQPDVFGWGEYEAMGYAESWSKAKRALEQINGIRG